LQVGIGDTIEPCIKQVALRAEDEVETVARSDLADVDLGCQRGKILRGDLRRCAGGAQRPVKAVADAPTDPERARRGRCRRRSA
jgi:hypothetical protein